MDKSRSTKALLSFQESYDSMFLIKKKLFDECLPDKHGEIYFELDKELRVPTWMIENGSTDDFTANSQKPLVDQTRKPGVI